MNWIDSRYIVLFDYVAFFLCLALAVMGVVSIAGATHEQLNNSLWIKQAVWVTLGLMCLFGAVLLDYRFLIQYAYVFYIGGVVCLLLCFSPLVGHVSHGARSWIKFPGLPFQLQPAELAKLTTIFLLARMLSGRQEKWNGLLDLIKPLAAGALPAVLILKQPDLGTAAVFGPVTLIMMFTAGLPFSYLLLLAAPALCLLGAFHHVYAVLVWIALMSAILMTALARKVPWTVWAPFAALALAGYVFVYNYGPVIWEKLPEHQKGRVIGYMDPEFDPNNTNYNINQSKIALGSGGFHGKGFGKGTQSTHGFLPEFQHDFIFPVIGEQFGFMGAVILLSLFLLLIMRGLDTALETKSLQGALLASGVVGMFFSHILINVGMVTGLLPVTGLPLTFISYGGTFMICSMIGVGLLINVRMRSSIEFAKDAFFQTKNPLAVPKRFRSEFDD